jgi:hypothetical protein
MNRKGRQTRRNYQVLRVDASPRGVNYIIRLRRGSRLCGAGAPFRPLFLPHSLVLCSGAGRLPFHHRALGPQHNRVSIGKGTSHVNSIPLWKSTCAGFRAAQHLSYRTRSARDRVIIPIPFDAVRPSSRSYRRPAASCQRPGSGATVSYRYNGTYRVFAKGIPYGRSIRQPTTENARSSFAPVQNYSISPPSSLYAGCQRT